MPAGPAGPAEVPSGTISPLGEESLEIDNRLAGQLLNLPFEFINVFEEAWEPIDEAGLEKMSEPFNLWLQEKGLTRLKRSEIVLGFWLLIYGSKQVKNVKKARIKRKAEKDAANNSRPAGDGKDKPGVVDRPVAAGSTSSDSGL